MQQNNSLLSDYPEGSDLTFLNSFYRYPKKQEDGKYSKDYSVILFKDNKTGVKQHRILESPEYQYYIANDDIHIDHNLLFIEKENVHKVTTPYNKLLKSIAQNTGNEDFFNQNIISGNRRANEELHTLYNVFNSDTNIDDHLRARFDKEYTNETIPISKAYFDIEVDTKFMKGDFPEMGECPINAVSYIYNGTVHSFLLRDSNNPLIEEFEKSINADLFQELHQFVINAVGGIEKAKKYHIDQLSYEFSFFDEEIALIQNLFMLINKQEPDFLLAWNMAFDIPYIIERLYELGYDPKDILCHPSFNDAHKVAEYFIDNDHFMDYAERGDKYTISSHTIYLDQLIHFASRRKGQKAFPDYKLDTAGLIIAGVRKLDYSHITTNISMLPYLDYKTFVFYNIMDTIVQLCIEEEVNDIDYVFSKCLMNNTRYEKCHRQTVYLCNRAAKSFYDDGFIIGNNPNRHTESKKFAGALVGNPLNNSDYSKLKQDGQIYNIVDNSNDFDFKSLYPSDDRQYNMAPNTQIGKILIDDQVHELENPFNFEYYDRGGQYLEDFTSENYISFCHRWLHYANFREFMEDMYYYFANIECIRYNQPYTNAFIKFGENAKLNAFSVNETNNAFSVYPDSLDYGLYLDKINYGG